MQQDDYRSAIEAAGLRIRTVRDNPSYRFISDNAQAAALSEAERRSRAAPNSSTLTATIRGCPTNPVGACPSIDLTDVFAQSIRMSLRLMRARADALLEILGAENYRERVKRRQAMLAGLDGRVLEARDLRRDGNDDPMGVMGRLSHQWPRNR